MHFVPRFAHLLALSFCVLLVAGAGAVRAEGGDLLWEDEFGRGALGIAVDGPRLFVAGDSSTGIWMVRAYHVGAGELVWEDEFSPGPGFGTARRIVVRSGTVFAAGRAYLAATDQTVWIVRAYDADTGELIWSDRFDLGGGSASPSAIAVGHGVVTVVGSATPPLRGREGEYDWIVRAYAPRTGDLLWQDRFDLGERANAALAVEISDGVAYVAGGAELEGPPVRAGVLAWVVRAHDASSGELLWEDFVDRGRFNVAAALEVQGQIVFASGYRWSGGGRQFAVRALDTATGELLWEDIFENGISGVAVDVAAHDGIVAAVGESSDPAAGIRWCLVRAYDAYIGTVLWEDVTAANGYTKCSAVSAGSGIVAAIGIERSAAGAYEFHVRAYAVADGQLLWSDSYDPGSETTARGWDVIVRDGTVYTAGESLAIPYGTAILRAYDGM